MLNATTAAAHLQELPLKTQDWSSFIPSSPYGKLHGAIDRIFCREVKKTDCDEPRVGTLPSHDKVMHEFAALASYEASCFREESQGDPLKFYASSGFFKNICLKMITQMTMCHFTMCSPQKRPLDADPYPDFVSNKCFFLILLRSLHLTIQDSTKEFFECGESIILKKEFLLKGAEALISSLSPDKKLDVQSSPEEETESLSRDSKIAETHFEKMVEAFEILTNSHINGKEFKENLEMALFRIASQTGFGKMQKVVSLAIQEYLETPSKYISDIMKSIKINTSEWEVLYLLLDPFLQDLNTIVEEKKQYSLPNEWTVPTKSLFDTGKSVKEYILLKCTAVANPHLSESQIGLSSSSFLSTSQIQSTSTNLTASQPSLTRSIRIEGKPYTPVTSNTNADTP